MGIGQVWRPTQGCSFPNSKKQYGLDGRAGAEVEVLGFPKDMPVSWIRELLMSTGEEVHSEGQTHGLVQRAVGQGVERWCPIQ